MDKVKSILIAILLAFSFLFISCAQARPPKPGPHFVWVPKHIGPNGKVIPGHWKYVGPPLPAGKHWVPGHFNKYGIWVPGHWAKN